MKRILLIISFIFVNFAFAKPELNMTLLVLEPLGKILGMVFVVLSAIVSIRLAPLGWLKIKDVLFDRNKSDIVPLKVYNDERFVEVRPSFDDWYESDEYLDNLTYLKRDCICK